MEITLTGIANIRDELNALKNTAFARPMLAEIGMYAIHRIKKRTLEGKDVSGIKFAPYSPLYAKERQKAGYQTAFVDLNRSGSMTSAMIYDSDSNSVDIFFMNTQDSTGARNPSKAFFLNEEREFFALSGEDVDGIMLIVKKYYQQVMGG